MGKQKSPQKRVNLGQVMDEMEQIFMKHHAPSYVAIEACSQMIFSIRMTEYAQAQAAHIANASMEMKAEQKAQEVKDKE